MKLGQARLVKEWKNRSLTGDDDEEMLAHQELARSLWPIHEVFWREEAEQQIPLGLEIKGRVEVGKGSGVFLVFQIDQIAQFLQNLWIIDYKTMGKNDDRNFQAYEMDMQPTAYVYGASKILGVRVAGIIIDGLIKTKTPQFRRERFIRTDEQLKEFEDEFVEIGREIAWRHHRVANGENWKTVFYKNTRHCFHWGRACDYLQLCQRDTPVMRMMYKQRDADYMDDPKNQLPAEPITEKP